MRLFSCHGGCEVCLIWRFLWCVHVSRVYVVVPLHERFGYTGIELWKRVHLHGSVGFRVPQTVDCQMSGYTQVSGSTGL